MVSKNSVFSIIKRVIVITTLIVVLVIVSLVAFYKLNFPKNHQLLTEDQRMQLEVIKHRYMPKKRPSKLKEIKVRPKIITEDVFDEDNNKLFNVITEGLPNLSTSMCDVQGYIFDNGKVDVGLDLYNPSTKTFTPLNNDDVSPFLYKISEHKYFYFPRSLYDSTTNKITKLSNDEIKKLWQKRERFENSRIKEYSSDFSNAFYFEFPERMELHKNKCHKDGSIYNCKGVWLEDHIHFKRYKYGKLNIRRNFFDAVLLENGKVLIIGGKKYSDKFEKEGHNNGLKSIELYDPKTGEVSTIGNMQYPRIEPKSIILNNHQVLIVGGKENELPGSYLNNAEVYDIKTGKSILIQNFGGAYGEKYKRIDIKPKNFEIVKLKNGKILLLGLIGSIFDPKTMKFYPLKKIRTPRINHTLMVLQDGKILATGGELPAFLTSCSDFEESKSAELITIKEY